MHRHSTSELTPLGILEKNSCARHSRKADSQLKKDQIRGRGSAGPSDWDAIFTPNS